MTGDLVAYVNQRVDTIPAAKKALVALARQLITPRPIEEMKQVENFAAALKIMFKGVDEVKDECELVILDARARIGAELELIPKASRTRERDGKGRLTKYFQAWKNMAEGLPASLMFPATV